jgi:hypothetical protein
MSRRITLTLAAVAVLAAGAVIGPIALAGPAGTGPCTDGSRACIIEAGMTYLNALATQDGSGIRAAENVRRTEQGNETANGREDLQASVETPIMGVISGIRDVRWFVDTKTGNGTAFYLMDTTTPGAKTPLHTATAHISERFKVVNGLITEIEAIFWIDPGPQEASSGWEQ